MHCGLLLHSYLLVLIRMKRLFQRKHDQLTKLVVSDCIYSSAFWVYTWNLFLLIYFYLFLIMELCKLTFHVYVCCLIVLFFFLFFELVLNWILSRLL